MHTKYGISISGRQVGRIMRENHLACEIRVARKISERKYIAAVVPDLVKRDYDNKNHKQNICASDVTYIVGTCDATQNFVYLCVIINHIVLRKLNHENYQCTMMQN